MLLSRAAIAAAALLACIGSAQAQYTVSPAAGSSWPVSGSLGSSLGTSGGWTTTIQGALSTTVQSVKSSAGQLGRVYCYNPNASVAYVQIFNATTGNVTLGSTTPTDFVPIAATATGGWAKSPVGDQYSTAISVAATTTYNGSTAPGTALPCSFDYN